MLSGCTHLPEPHLGEKKKKKKKRPGPLGNGQLRLDGHVVFLIRGGGMGCMGCMGVGEWPTAGEFFTGVVGGTFLFHPPSLVFQPFPGFEG